MNTARDLTQILEAPHVLNNVVMIDNLQFAQTVCSKISRIQFTQLLTYETTKRYD